MKRKKRRGLALMLALCLGGSSLQVMTSEAAGKGQKSQDAVVVDVTDYGVHPDGGGDSAEGIQQAIAEAKKVSDEDKSVIINFPEGRYDIYPDKSAERELYITNTVGTNASYKNKKIGILLEDMKNVTVEGNGSLFMFHGKMTTFAAIDCENVTFQHCKVDFQVPTVIDITVEKVEGNTATVYVPECYNYQISGTNVIWSGDVSPYTGEVYWTERNNTTYTQRFDTKNGLTWRGSTGSNPVFSNVSSITDAGNNRLVFTYSTVSSELEEGICYQMRSTVRDHAGTFFWKSKNVTLEDLDIYFLHGFGMVGQLSEGLTLHDVDFEAPADSGRTTAGYADFIQMSGCKGQIEISDCTFSNPHDDPINIHGTFLQVVEKISDNKIKVRYKHNETAGFPNFFVGDEIEFSTQGNMLPVEDSVRTVTAVDGPDGAGGDMGEGSGSLTDIILTLDEAIPDSVTAYSYVVENITYTPSVYIHDNEFKETPTRGILVTTRKPVVIENNTFDGMGMAGIYISNDAQSWYESGRTTDVTIRNNTFTRGKAEAILVEPTNPNVSTERTVHENMTIEGNTFYMDDNTVLNAKSVKDLTFKNNTIYRQDPDVSLEVSAENTELTVGSSEQLTVAQTGTALSSQVYKFNGCKNVTLEGNTYDAGLNMGVQLSNMTAEDVTRKDGAVNVGGSNSTSGGGTVYYESTDGDVLKVSAGGRVTAVGVGNASVKTCVVSGGRKYTGNEIDFTVAEGSAGVLPTGITITTETEKTSGDPVEYEAEVSGEDGADDTVTWQVVDADKETETTKAVINENGTLTPQESGVVEVIATTVNGLEARKLLAIQMGGLELADNLTIESEVSGRWQISGKDQIVLQTANGGLWATQTPANLFKLPIMFSTISGDGDFELTLKMDGKTEQGYEDAGLILYKDADNYTAVQRKHGGGNPGIMVVNEVERSATEDGVSDIAAETVWFKLVKCGNTITGYYSEDGMNWTTVREVTNHKLTGQLYIAFAAQNNGGETNTAFTFSELTVNGEPVSLTQETSADLPTVKDVKVKYTEEDNEAKASYETSKGDTALVKWAVSDTKDGFYSIIESVSGKKLSTIASWKDRYIRAAVVPFSEDGMVGDIVWSDPAKVTGDGTASTPDSLKSANAYLESCEIGGLASGITFDKNTTTYYTTATTDERNITAAFAPEDENASVEVTFNREEADATGGEFLLTSGRNLFEVKVTAEDGVTVKNYRITISRTGDQNTALAALRVDGNEITLEDGVYTYSYNAGEAGEVKVEAETESAASKAVISVGGAVTEDGMVTLKEGSNEVVVTVRPETGGTSSKYTLNIKVAKADNANLEDISFTGNAALNEKFAADTTEYTVSVNESNIVLNALAEEKNAVIQVYAGDEAAAEGTGSVQAPLTVKEGENTVTVKVTAADGETEKEYKLTLIGQSSVYLSDLNWVSENSGDGGSPTRKDKSCGNHTITLWDGEKEVEFEKGIGSHAVSELVYDLSDGNYKTFSTYYGVDRETRDKPSEPNMLFEVYADDVLIHSSSEIMYYHSAYGYTGELDISGVSELKLVMKGDKNTWSAHGDWADAKLTGEFASPVYTVTAGSADETMGSVSMDHEDGSYTVNTLAAVTALPQEGYQFAAWKDADGIEVSTVNPYTFIVTGDVELTAYFEAIPEKPEPTAEEILAQIKADGSMPETLEKGTEILTLPAVPEGAKIEITAVEPEGIIALDGKVTTPEKDTEVTVTLTVTDAKGDTADAEFKVMVEGKNESENPNPENPGQTGDGSGDQGGNQGTNSSTGGRQTNGGSVSDKAVKTGDSSNYLAWGITAAAALACAAAALRFRRRGRR